MNAILRNNFVSLHIILPFLKQMSAVLSKLTFSFLFLFLTFPELAEFEIGLINYLHLLCALEEYENF